MSNPIAAETNTEIVTLELKWFSVLAEHRKKRSETIQVQLGMTGTELIEYISGDFPMLKKYKKHVRIAVNRDYVEPGHVLKDGDEIAFITPVSGG